MAVRAVEGAGADGVRFVALERQHAPIANQLNAAFVRLLGSSAFTLGEEVERFEAEFASFCEVSHCVGVASGTAALELMIRACGIGPGDEVVVPGHTFIASALAVAHAGATPVLCDVDEGTGLIDPDAARAAVGPRTAAVLAVHLYGQCCDMDGLSSLTEPRGLLLLEDPSKNLGGLGDGGAVCTHDEMLAARVRRLGDLGQRAKGEHVELGYNERLDGLQAALLRVKLPYADLWNNLRREHAERYRELFAPEVRIVKERPETPSVYHVFPVRFERPAGGRHGAARTRNRDRCSLRHRRARASRMGRSRNSSWGAAGRGGGPPRSSRCRCTLPSNRRRLSVWLTPSTPRSPSAQ